MPQVVANLAVMSSDIALHGLRDLKEKCPFTTGGFRVSKDCWKLHDLLEGFYRRHQWWALSNTWIWINFFDLGILVFIPLGVDTSTKIVVVLIRTYEIWWITWYQQRSWQRPPLRTLPNLRQAHEMTSTCRVLIFIENSIIFLNKFFYRLVLWLWGNFHSFKGSWLARRRQMCQESARSSRHEGLHVQGSDRETHEKRSLLQNHLPQDN